MSSGARHCDTWPTGLGQPLFENDLFVHMANLQWLILDILIELGCTNMHMYICIQYLS